MRITYIRHSAFLAEWEDIVCLFDYAEGELPEIDRDKRLCVFVSHHHSDHFNPEIFTRFADHPRHTFILSDDIRTVPAGEKAPVVRTGPNCRRIFPGGKEGGDECFHHRLDRLRRCVRCKLRRKDRIPRGRSPLVGVAGRYAGGGAPI